MAQPSPEALWIGSITVVAWMICIGSAIWIGHLELESIRAFKQVDDVLESLRRLQ